MASGDLIDVHADYMDLPAQVFELLGGLCPDGRPLNKPEEAGPFAEAAGVCLI